MPPFDLKSAIGDVVGGGALPHLSELFLRMEPSAPARLAGGIEARLSRRSA